MTGRSTICSVDKDLLPGEVALEHRSNKAEGSRHQKTWGKFFRDRRSSTYIPPQARNRLFTVRKNKEVFIFSTGAKTDRRREGIRAVRVLLACGPLVDLISD